MYQVGDKVAVVIVGEVTKVEKDYNGTINYSVKSVDKDKKGIAYDVSESSMQPLASKEA